MISRYLKIWKQLSALSVGSFLSNRVDSFSFLLGKLVRFVFFMIFIISIFQFTDTLAGYTKYQVLLFFVTYFLADTLPQAFFRGIYLFHDDVRLGNFDFILAKPVSPLFYILSRLIDLLDFIFLVPIIALLIFIIIKLGTVTITGIIAYVFFIFVGQFIYIGIQIFIASITLRTLESNNILWVYRYSFFLGQYPPEILSNNIRLFFTFIIPVIIIVSVPVKALLGTLSITWGLLALIYAIFFTILVYYFWKNSLKHYSSASS